MSKDVVRGALGIASGVILVLLGSTWVGVTFGLLGLLSLGIAWRFRGRLPLDPVLEADVRKAMRLERSDPAAAARLLESAWEDADSREQRELAQLRSQASIDRRAAVQLRNRLRAKLTSEEAARRRAEKSLGTRPTSAALLKELDRVANATRQQLTEAEQHLERFHAS
jgi:hypothetical protein